MKVIMIDPWGVNNIMHYTNGICKGISNYCDLTLVTNIYYKNTTDAKYLIKPIFFKTSEKMKHGKLRKAIRGIEYLDAYNKIIKELKKEQYDIVHIQWLLMYKTDIRCLKQIKKYCKKIVYTAHNVVPHSNWERFIDDLKKIYELVDTIILHGEGIRDEFASLFPDFKEKVIIQRYGTYLNQSTQFALESIDKDIIDKVEKYNRVFIYFGNMFYNKGVDRLAKIWLENFMNEDQLLIIVGGKNSEYTELNELELEINDCENIMYIKRSVEDNLLNYLIDKSEIILLPYRHASMSQGIFTAAEFKKTVLCTDTGSIAEYVVNGQNSFVVANQDEMFCEKLKYISTEVSRDVLSDMGNRLSQYIASNYSWDSIGKKLVEDAYRM